MLYVQGKSKGVDPNRGKPVHVTFSGTKRVEEGTSQGWSYLITQTKMGVTVRRNVFQGTLWYGGMAYREYLSGFHSASVARQALLARIQEMVELHKKPITSASNTHANSLQGNHFRKKT